MDTQPTQQVQPTPTATDSPVGNNQPDQTNSPVDNQTNYGMAAKPAVAATPNDKPTSDDEELAKVLAGLTTDMKPPEETSQIPKTPEISAVSAPAVGAAENPPMLPSKPDIPAEFMMPAPPVILPNSSPNLSMPEANDQPKDSGPSPELEDVRKNALNELRPLVSTLELSPEEKFDIHLLLLRSTDDTSLIAPAYDIAKQISDENKRAQALLDIIKEIDYLSNPEQ